MTFHSEVWSDVLIPHMSDDEVIIRLWMTAHIVQTLIRTRLLSLVIKVRRISGSSDTGDSAYYTHPPFFLQLNVLQYLWIMLPMELRTTSDKPGTIGKFPPSLRFIETDRLRMLNTERFLSDGSQVIVAPEHFTIWLSSRNDTAVGPMLMKQLVSTGGLLEHIWRIALHSVKHQKYILPTDPHLVRHLTHLPDDVYVKLRALAPPLWETAIFKSLAEQVVSCQVYISEPCDAEWLIVHFPNLVHLHGRSPLLPPRLGGFSLFTGVIVNGIAIPSIIPPLPSSLTKIVLGVNHGPWPSRWPEQLIDFHVSINAGNVTVDDFRSHIHTLPARLEMFSYQIQGGMDGHRWDVETMSALPRTLKSLTVPNLPDVWTKDEVAILAELPNTLTRIEVRRDYGGPWMEDLSTAAWKILPVGLTSLVITTREAPCAIASDTTLDWKRAKVRDMSELVGRFPNVVSLTVAVIGLEDPLPAFSDNVKNISIRYCDYVKYPYRSTNVFWDGVQWPLRLGTVHIVCNPTTMNSTNISLRSLGSLPDTVLTLSVVAYSAGLVDFPRKWPRQLVNVTISTDSADGLISGAIEHTKESLPNTNRVHFIINSRRLHYTPHNQTLYRSE